MRPDLERSGHGSLGLARRVVAFGYLAAGLIQLGFYFVSEFKLVFQEIINPRANPLDFGAGQFWNGRFNFLDRTHAGKIIQCGPFEKPVISQFSLRPPLSNAVSQD